MLPPVIFPAACNVLLKYPVPVTPIVVVGLALANPTLPDGKIVTTTAGVAVVPVKISTLAFPAASV